MAGPFKTVDIPTFEADQKVGPVLDTQNTTLENVLRLLIKDKYTPNILDGVSGYQGIVLRVINEKQKFEYSNRTEISTRGGVVVPKYKVWVPGPVFSIFRKPLTFDENPDDRLLIDLLPDFSAANTINRGLNVGEAVWVTFGNQSNFKDPVIEYAIIDVPNGTATPPPVAAAGTPSGAFPPNQPPPTPSEIASSKSLSALPRDGKPLGPRPTAPPTMQGNPSDNKFAIYPVMKGDKCKGDPELYLKIAKQFDVENNFRYAQTSLPRTEIGPDGKYIVVSRYNQTYCNIFVWDVCCAYGAKYPYMVDSKRPDSNPIFYEGFTGNNIGQPGNIPLSSVSNKTCFQGTALMQYNWMIYGNNAKKAGWRKVNVEEAQNRANQGFLTWGAFQEPSSHVWLVIPDPERKPLDRKKGIFMAQAGARNVFGVYSEIAKFSGWIGGKAHYWTVDCDSTQGATPPATPTGS